MLPLRDTPKQHSIFLHRSALLLYFLYLLPRCPNRVPGIILNSPSSPNPHSTITHHWFPLHVHLSPSPQLRSGSWSPCWGSRVLLSFTSSDIMHLLKLLQSCGLWDLYFWFHLQVTSCGRNRYSLLWICSKTKECVSVESLPPQRREPREQNSLLCSGTLNVRVDFSLPTKALTSSLCYC